MTEFEIDKQTVNDLGLFSEDNVSVYSFFNKVITIGGERKLKQMMDTPSFDRAVLTSRQQTTRYFYDNRLKLPVNKKDVDFIEHYLAYNKSPLRPNLFDATVGRVRNYFSPVDDHYIIKQGIQDIHKLVFILNDFYQQLNNYDDNSEINGIAVTLNTFLAKHEIKKLISIDPDKEMVFLNVSYYDNLFRKIEINNLKDLLNVVYRLDAYIAIANAAEKYGFCFPEYAAAGEYFVKISGLYHPCINNAVANDTVIEVNQNIIFLTGANMAGKSSFLKALGISVYLAHVGFPVPAKHMQTSVFNGLITTINLSDNINSGYSHYFSEVNRIKEIALKINSRVKLFVIFDELFRGTNVKDAYDASLATIKAISAIKNCVFLISTHIVELSAELIAIDNIAFKYFNAEIKGGKPRFDYKLKDGVSSETLGYYIFKNEGIIEILNRAAENRNEV